MRPFLLVVGVKQAGKGGDVRVPAERLEPDATERVFDAGLRHIQQRRDALAVYGGMCGDGVDGCMLERVVEDGQNARIKQQATLVVKLSMSISIYGCTPKKSHLKN